MRFRREVRRGRAGEDRMHEGCMTGENGLRSYGTRFLHDFNDEMVRMGA